MKGQQLTKGRQHWRPQLASIQVSGLCLLPLNPIVAALGQRGTSTPGSFACTQLSPKDHWLSVAMLHTQWVTQHPWLMQLQNCHSSSSRLQLLVAPASLGLYTGAATRAADSSTLGSLTTSCLCLSTTMLSSCPLPTPSASHLVIMRSSAVSAPRPLPKDGVYR